MSSSLSERLGEAPVDNEIHGRRNREWAEVVGGGGETDHAHSNKSTLDATTASFLTAEKTAIADNTTHRNSSHAPSNATDDQTDSEIETAYNNQVPVISQAEAEAGTSTSVRRITPQRIAQAIAALAAAGGGEITVQDEGSTLTTALASMNFVGSGVEVTEGAEGVLTITIAGGSGLALGETSSTAYRGDRGAAAYDHISDDGKDHSDVVLNNAHRVSAHAPSNATADQTDSEIEIAYNAQVDVVSQVEAEAGTSTTVRRWTAQRIAQAIAALNTFTSTLLTKLNGIDDGANNYSHPAKHPPSIITQDATNRFTTDAEKSTWNGKQDALGYTPENLANKGVNSGYASLDSSGLVPAAQLPSYVDSVQESANYAALPVTGEASKIYVTLDDNKNFRWTGTVYVEVSPSEVNSVAGKTGVVTLDSDDISEATNQYYTEARVNANTNVAANTTHRGVVTGNPHSVTQTEIGLGNVDNTSDANKPVSTAQQTEIDTKPDLGETSSDAYRGDRGLTAYNHSQSAHAPSNATDDQTDAEIKTAYENNVNTNAFNDSYQGYADQFIDIQDTDTDPSGFNRYDLTTMPIFEVCHLASSGEYRRVEPDGTHTLITGASFFGDGTTALADTTVICRYSSGSSFYYFSNGIKYTHTTTQSVVYDDTSTGIKAISFDGATLEYNAISAINEIIQQHAFVCILYFNLTNDEVQLIADERHGMHMPAATHMYNHNTYGARYSGGFDPAGFVDASGTYTQTNSGSLWDEDIEINAPVQTSHPFIYRLGSNGDWNWTTADLNVSYNGGGNAYYNEDTGATWQLTTIPNNDYSLVHFVATNDSRYPVVKILGQEDYPSRNTARAAIETEIASIKFGGLPSAEFIFLYSIIVRHSNVLQDLADGSTFVDFRSGVTGAGGTAATVTDHGDLLGLGDNDHPQYLQNLVEDTTPQQGGDVDLNGFGDKLTGQTVAGSNGDWVRLSGAETWTQADASVEATSVGQLGRRISATEVLVSGHMAATGLTAGATYYISETAGGMVTTAPTDPGTIRRIVGHAVTTTLFMVNPSGTWLEN